MSRLILDGWQVVIGIETHVQLKTRQKLFSRANTALLSHPPNSRHNVFDAAFPGTLPKLNPKCVELADTGKSLYNARSRTSFIDLNRAGTGLLEIVTEPDMNSPEEAAEYVRSLQTTLRGMGISDGNMEAGDLRCDVNVSMNRPGQAMGTRCEIKNLNSVRFMVAAIQHEIERQKNILSAADGIVTQETRGFDENRWETYTMRSKEDAPDYRYMPDPNLGPLVVNETTIERVRNNLPESAESTRARLFASYGPQGVSEANIDVLMGLDTAREVPFDGEDASQRDSAVAYFESVAQGRDPRDVINWITQNLLGQLSAMDERFSSKRMPAIRMGELIDLVSSAKMTRPSGKLLLRHVLTNQIQPDQTMESIATELDLIASAKGDADQYTDVCSRAIAALPREVVAIRAGNVNVINKLIGWVMKDTKGKVDVQKVRSTMEELIRKQ
ncbi:hypothetical protein VNI00_003922 [Paramarasmius palmivorus]|uniref:Asn/Gln amidotransferase domain-containing protein n=1 Tax=Paramarasmius palmivorus TaxID=297713 RepID=A0AAW0DQJ6_9AGAR